MKLEKMAQKDAEMWAAAEMAYGEGAGTRRKLAQAELDSKYNMPGYYEAFCAAYDSLDLNKFAQQAIKERKRADRALKAGQNFRALKSGNLSNLTTGVFIVGGAAYLAHKTGYDKVLEAKAKELYRKAKIEVKARRMKGVVYNITNVTPSEEQSS